MEVILNIVVFGLVIAASFYVGSMFGSQYVLYLLKKRGYVNKPEKTKQKDLNKDLNKTELKPDKNEK